jgi:hypothetical protein
MQPGTRILSLSSLWYSLMRSSRFIQMADDFGRVGTRNPVSPEGGGYHDGRIMPRLMLLAIQLIG